tara:strand:+ start:1095 stop:1331 length:237 start_codon:yes stop_codon:yes gene_type:complete
MSSKCESCDIETKNTKFCDKCVKRYNLSNKTVEPKEEIRLSTDDLLSVISKNVGIITFIISFQFILSVALAAYFWLSL